MSPAREGIKAVLSEVIMAAYAALSLWPFDLWIAAVNLHPALAAKSDRKEWRGSTAGLVSAFALLGQVTCNHMAFDRGRSFK